MRISDWSSDVCSSDLHYRQCRECMAARKWAKKNPERHRESGRAWVDGNRSRAREIWRDMAKRKRQSPSYRLHGRISNQVWQVIRHRQDCRKALALLGYSQADLRPHLKRQFLNGMRWEQMNEWQITQ